MLAHCKITSKASDISGSLHLITVAITFAGTMICLFYQLSSSFIAKERLSTADTNADTGKKTSNKTKKQKMSMSE